MFLLFSVWTVYEQVCIAALDCQNIDIAEVYFDLKSVNIYIKLLLKIFHIDIMIIIYMYHLNNFISHTILIFVFPF